MTFWVRWNISHHWKLFGIASLFFSFKHSFQDVRFSIRRDIGSCFVTHRTSSFLHMFAIESVRSVITFSMCVNDSSPWVCPGGHERTGESLWSQLDPWIPPSCQFTHRVKGIFEVMSSMQVHINWGGSIYYLTNFRRRRSRRGWNIKQDLQRQPGSGLCYPKHLHGFYQQINS